MSDTPADWITLDAAAARLGCSTRTLQRRIATGELRSQRREDGRTLVAVDQVAPTPCPTSVVDPALVERLERQAEDTNRVAALAACAAEQSALAFRDRLQTVEAALSDARSTASSWRMAFTVAASVTVAATVVVGYLVGDRAATVGQVSDMANRLDRAEADRDALQADLAAATALRQVSDARAEQLAAEVLILRHVAGVPTDDCPTLVAVDE